MLPVELFDAVFAALSPIDVGGGASAARLACVCQNAAAAYAGRPKSDAVRVSPASGRVWEPASGRFDVEVALGDNLTVAFNRIKDKGGVTTVLIRPGLHAGRMELRGGEGEVHVFGRGATIVATDNQPLVTLDLVTATIDNLTLRRPRGAMLEDESERGCVIVDRASLRLQRCFVECANEGEGVVVRNPGDFFAERLDRVNEVVIADCDIHDCTTAVDINVTSSWRIQRCDIHNNVNVGLTASFFHVENHYQGVGRPTPEVFDNVFRDNDGSDVQLDHVVETTAFRGNAFAGDVRVEGCRVRMASDRVRNVEICARAVCDMYECTVSGSLSFDDATGRIEDNAIAGDVVLANGARPSVIRNVVNAVHVRGARTEGRLTHNTLRELTVNDGADPIVCFNAIGKSFRGFGERGVFFENRRCR